MLWVVAKECQAQSPLKLTVDRGLCESLTGHVKQRFWAMGARQGQVSQASLAMRVGDVKQLIAVIG